MLTSTPKVVPYFDLSFQHSAPDVLRAMRRFGDTDRFLELLDTIRSKAPQAGVRSNFIVGFPGETEADLAELERFLNGARLDAIGVFGYSDEDGTEAATYENKLDEDVVAERLARVSRLAEELVSQRAEERVGETVQVLVESVDDEEGAYGRGAHQAPETDGQVLLRGRGDGSLSVGRMVEAKVVGTEGVDLVAELLPGSLAARSRGGGQMTGVPASAAGGSSAREGRGRGSGSGAGVASGAVSGLLSTSGRFWCVSAPRLLGRRADPVGSRRAAGSWGLRPSIRPASGTSRTC